jgi:predicted MFS family arabinose efflux permease
VAVVSLILIPVVLTSMAPQPAAGAAATAKASNKTDETLGQALKGRKMWVLLGVYSICGFQDFFVATHIVAFAQDNGVQTLMAGNLLAFMGLAGVLGVLFAGFWSDKTGPHQATFACFVMRIAIFALILFDQSALSISIFALLYGVTFWLTAPLAVVFVRNAFGGSHIGAISGLIVMLHHMSGGIGAYVGAVMFDLNRNYGVMFWVMLATSVIAAILCLGLPKKRQSTGNLAAQAA